MSRYILGIDPGLQGALALYHIPSTEPENPLHCPALALPTRKPEPTEPVALHDMPVRADGTIDVHGLVRQVEKISTHCLGNVTAAVENVHGMPRQAGVFVFGYGVGLIHGILASFEIPYHQISPAMWKGSMGLRRRPDESKDQNKDRSRALASQLFPYAASQFARKRDDGRAEALLIAVYFANVTLINK